MKSLILCSVLILFSWKSYAQNEIGLIPQINLSFKLGSEWKVNSKFEGRQIFFKNPYPQGRKEREFDRFDTELIASRNIDPLHSWGGGYMIRRADGFFTHRIIQQFAITQRLLNSRISHRFRTDQTFEKNESVQVRLRYRLSWEKPLNGQELDPEEFYLKLNNEYIGLLQDKKEDIEIRGLANLGYKLSDKNQLETGIDYRFENVTKSETTHKFFLSIGLFRSF